MIIQNKNLYYLVRKESEIKELRKFLEELPVEISDDVENFEAMNDIVLAYPNNESKKYFDYFVGLDYYGINKISLAFQKLL